MTRRAVLLVVGVVAVLGLGLVVHQRSGNASDAPPAGHKGGGDRVVPVRTSVVQKEQVPIYLDGLGSATAYATVTVRSQVDGQLQKVAFTEGQEVKKGDLLAQIDPRPFTIQLHQAQAALARDKATLDNAELNLKRNQELAEKKLVSPQDVDNQRALADQARAAVQADQAQIESANLNLTYARITSPISGVTGVRQVDVGNLVHTADTTGIVVLTQLDPIAVLFTLPQDDLPRVSEAMANGPLEVTVQSRDGQTELGKGQLLLVDNQMNAATATMRLKAVIPNPKRLLWPNQFVRARLLLNVQKDAHTLPAAALQTGPQGLFVYVVKADSTVEPRPVKLQLVQGETAIVESGVQPGEVVVTDGQGQLKPGAKVSASGAEPGGGKVEAREASEEAHEHAGHRGGGAGPRTVSAQ